MKLFSVRFNKCNDHRLHTTMSDTAGQKEYLRVDASRTLPKTGGLFLLDQSSNTELAEKKTHLAEVRIILFLKKKAIFQYFPIDKLLQAPANILTRASIGFCPIQLKLQL